MKKLPRNLIIAVSLVLVLVFLFVGNLQKEKKAEELTRSNLFSEEQPLGEINKIQFPQSKMMQPSSREIQEYYDRRQYHGAPPIIPHPIEKALGDNNCLSCHQNGGYVAKFDAYTPITPHPNYVVCQQCHVAESTQKNFLGMEIEWKSVQPPKIKRAAIAGGPPPIPHSLQLRENCLSCHDGPGAVKQIRTPHPERVNCTQCHVPQSPVGEWTRK